MTNLLEQAISCDDGELAAKIIQDALGIESDDVGELLLPQGMANGSRTARCRHRRMASVGSALPGLTSSSGQFLSRPCESRFQLDALYSSPIS